MQQFLVELVVMQSFQYVPLIIWRSQTRYLTLKSQLYPGQDTFEFDQGHVTKNQPITVLVLLSWRLRLSYSFCIAR